MLADNPEPRIGQRIPARTLPGTTPSRSTDRRRPASRAAPRAPRDPHWSTTPAISAPPTWGIGARGRGAPAEPEIEVIERGAGHADPDLPGPRLGIRKFGDPDDLGTAVLGVDGRPHQTGIRLRECRLSTMHGQHRVITNLPSDVSAWTPARHRGPGAERLSIPLYTSGACVRMLKLARSDGTRSGSDGSAAATCLPNRAWGYDARHPPAWSAHHARDVSSEQRPAHASRPRSRRILSMSRRAPAMLPVLLLCLPSSTRADATRRTRAGARVAHPGTSPALVGPPQDAVRQPWGGRLGCP